MTKDSSQSPQVAFVSHGGGPTPLLGAEGHQQMVSGVQALAGTLRRPSAIMVISAHWEAPGPRLIAGPRPQLIYDYHGFPPAAYDIQYPAPGAPELAQQAAAQLQRQGFAAEADGERGFDHGMFVPLKLMFPEADIPCVQLSLLADLDPGRHMALGQALAQLDYPGLLILGSGLTFHNLRAFSSPNNSESRTMNESFEAWLMDTCSNTRLTETERHKKLAHWVRAPFARYCHPREEHLLPLHVCYGAAQRACDQVYQMQILGKQASAYRWD